MLEDGYTPVQVCRDWFIVTLSYDRSYWNILLLKIPSVPAGAVGSLQTMVPSAPRRGPGIKWVIARNLWYE